MVYKWIWKYYLLFTFFFAFVFPDQGQGSCGSGCSRRRGRHWRGRGCWWWWREGCPAINRRDLCCTHHLGCAPKEIKQEMDCGRGKYAGWNHGQGAAVIAITAEDSGNTQATGPRHRTNHLCRMDQVCDGGPGSFTVAPLPVRPFSVTVQIPGHEWWHQTVRSHNPACRVGPAGAGSTAAASGSTATASDSISTVSCSTSTYPCAISTTPNPISGVRYVAAIATVLARQHADRFFSLELPVSRLRTITDAAPSADNTATQALSVDHNPRWQCYPPELLSHLHLRHYQHPSAGQRVVF